MSKPAVDEHTTKVLLAFPKQFYSAVVNQDGNTITFTLKKENCRLLLNGRADISETVRDSLRITCNRAKMMRDYYTFV